MRICSFLPSATEIVYELGLGDSLTSVSHECDFPAEAKDKPKVVRAKFDSNGMSSAEINAAVSKLVTSGERIYDIDNDVLKSANPDLVLTQQLCDVCAISFDDVQKAVLQLDTAPKVMSLDPSSVADVIADVERVGEATGTASLAREVAEGLRERVEIVRSEVKAATSTPKVATVEWLDPLILSGHWVPEMVEIAGGAHGIVGPGEASPVVSLDDLVAYDPDILVLMPCGMDVDRAIKEFSQLETLDTWKSLRAVTEGRLYAADGGAIFSRSGPRLVDGIELLAQIIHPELFGYAQGRYARMVTEQEL